MRSLQAVRLSSGKASHLRDPNGLEPFDVRQRVRGAYEILRRRGWLMLAVLIGIVSSGVLYLVKTPPEYTASSFLIVDDQRYDPSNALNMGYVAGLDNTSAEMQLQVLTKSPVISRNVAEKVLELRVVPGTDQPFTALGDGTEEPTVASVASFLQQNVFTIASGGTNVIGVTASTSHPAEASFLANTFAAEAVDHSRDMSRQRISASRGFLEERIEEGRQSLAASERDVQYYMDRERAVAIDQEVTTAVANLAHVEGTLGDAQIELEMQRASLSATEDELARIKPVLSRRVASGVDREIELAQLRVAEIEARLEPVYQLSPHLREQPGTDPRTAPLEAELSQLKERITQLSERYVQELLAAGGGDPSKPESGVTYAASLERQLVTGRIAISGIESKIGQLERQRRDYETRLGAFPKQSVELAKLQRARESSEELYSFLERRLNEVTLAEQSETGSLRILRPAGIPAVPNNPKPERIIPLSILLGILMSAGVGLLATRLDRRLYTPADVERHGAHLLGVVPDMKPLIKELFGGAAMVPHKGRDVMSTMIGLTAPLSAPAETYRHLYARLRSMRLAGGAHTIVVTSPEANVGKSTTALNLAIASATAHRRTLVVDVDFRRPAVESYLGTRDGLTLQDLMELPAGLDPTPQLLERTATDIPHLHAVTLREAVGNPLEHLASPRLRWLVEQFEKEFDVVIFDAPPLLLTADATFFTSMCDVTVIVAGAGTTNEEALLRIQQELSEADAGFTCVVLNRFDPSNRNFRSTYGYLSYNYGSYYEKGTPRQATHNKQAL